MLKDLVQMATAAINHELASQMGITHDTIAQDTMQWAMSALMIKLGAVKIGPLFESARKVKPCQGCPA